MSRLRSVLPAPRRPLHSQGSFLRHGGLLSLVAPAAIPAPLPSPPQRGQSESESSGAVAKCPAATSFLPGKEWGLGSWSQMEGASSSCQEGRSDVVIVTKGSALFAGVTQVHCAGLGTGVGGDRALCQEDPPHGQNPRKKAQHLAPLLPDGTCGEGQGGAGTLQGPGGGLLLPGLRAHAQSAPQGAPASRSGDGVPPYGWVLIPAQGWVLIPAFWAGLLLCLESWRLVLPGKAPRSAAAGVWPRDHCPLRPLVRSKCGWDVAHGPTATPTLNFRALGSSQSSSCL